MREKYELVFHLRTSPSLTPIFHLKPFFQKLFSSCLHPVQLAKDQTSLFQMIRIRYPWIILSVYSILVTSILIIANEPEDCNNSDEHCHKETVWKTEDINANVKQWLKSLETAVSEELATNERFVRKNL